MRQVVALTKTTADRWPAPSVGTIASLSDAGVPMVTVPGADEAVPARVLAPIDGTMLRAALLRRAEVMLFFDGGDPSRPIIAGILQAEGLLAEEEVVRVDGKRLVIEGQDEVVITCGEASMTLRRNGKIVIKGDAVETHSRGVQRITGAQIKIN
jgi:hypothetical protein